MAKTRRLDKKRGEQLGITCFPNIHYSGSIKGMKKLYWGREALLVHCGAYIYNVSLAPHIYYASK